MRLEIGIDDKDRSHVAKGLRALLADEFVLSTKTRGFHWNVVGSDFSELHKLFETQYEVLGANIDEIAERIRTLGKPSPGSLGEFVADSRLKESAGKVAEGGEMLPDLLEDHEALIRILREDARSAVKHGDEGTAGLLTGLIEKHEKTAWMLRSHLARVPRPSVVGAAARRA